MEYFDDLYAIRQIKLQILCEYEVKTSEMNIWALSEDLCQILWYTFSQKCEKCQTWVLEHHIKMDYVQNLRINPTKPKLGPQNVLYDTSCPFLKLRIILKVAIFC